MIKILFGVLIVSVGVIKGLGDPFWGLAASSLFVHIPPIQLSYKFVPLRIALLVSLVTLFSYISSSKYSKKFSFWPAESWLMIWMYIGMRLSAINAHNTDAVSLLASDFFKFIIYFILLINILDSKYKIDWFFNALVISAAWLVYRCFDLRGTTGPRFENINGGVVDDCNQFAAACILLFPLVVRKVFKGPWWMRIGAAMGSFGLIMTVMITGSRGGFLGLAVVFLGFITLYKGRRKQIIVSLILLIAVAHPFVPSAFRDRVAGLFHKDEESGGVENESSAASRLASWNLSFEVWKEYPILGCGMKNFGYYMGYRVEGLDWGQRGHEAHSLWFEILAQGGIVVSTPFLLMLFLFFYRTTKVSRKYASLSYQAFAEDIYVLQIGMLGFLVSATFINRMMYEPIYWWCGLAVAHSRVQEEILKQDTSSVRTTRRR